jgi:hypothetical protein
VTREPVPSHMALVPTDAVLKGLIWRLEPGPIGSRVWEDPPSRSHCLHQASVKMSKSCSDEEDGVLISAGCMYCSFGNVFVYLEIAGMISGMSEKPMAQRRHRSHSSQGSKNVGRSSHTEGVSHRTSTQR